MQRTHVACVGLSLVGVGLVARAIRGGFVGGWRAKSTSIRRIEPSIPNIPSSPAFSRIVCLDEPHGPLVYVSGTGAGNDIGGPAREGTATEETRWSLENMAQLLKIAGSGMDRVVSVSMLLTEKSDYAEINLEYVKHFPAGLPSRSTAMWGVPTTAKVAFSCVAVADTNANVNATASATVAGGSTTDN
jgi:2-iminobutanoate/2-iminopropanoate deaminase